MKEVDLVFFYFLFLFLFSFILFLELGLGLGWQNHTIIAGHIRWHSHKSHDIWKEIEGLGRMMSYNVWNTCWP